jgi:cell division protein FtsB
MAEMLGVRRRYRMRRFFANKIAFVVVLLLLVILTQAAVGMYYKAKETKVKRDIVAQELERLKAREAELEAENTRLSSGRGIEEEIRDRYLVAKEGERVAIISGGDTSPQNQPKIETQENWWDDLLSLVIFWRE